MIYEGDWSVINGLINSIKVPKMVKVRQKFVHPQPIDVSSEIIKQLKDGYLDKLKAGDTVAITVGSRGISNMVDAVTTIGKQIKEKGGIPFIVPAMGSHAAATAEGQKNMLLGMGFTPEATGMEIKSSMETVLLGYTEEEHLPVLCDKNAASADYQVIINRIKPHVCFRGKYESGLMKMLTIGLGKQQGAEIAHNLGFGHMPDHIRLIGSKAIEKLNILFAVGLVENAFHETAIAKVMHGCDIPKIESELLETAKSWAAKLHFTHFDTLIIDEIGKNISGSGFDTNVVGRYHSEWASGGPVIRRVAILDIAKESKGNGNGLGMADFTTMRAVNKFDFAQTFPNTLTALLTGGVKIPMPLQSDKLAYQACMKTSYHSNWEETNFVRIHNTLCLEEIEVSENLLPYIKDNPDKFEILSEPYELSFDKNGNLLGAFNKGFSKKSFLLTSSSGN